MKYRKKYLNTLAAVGLCLSSLAAQAETSFSAGFKLLPGHGWTGNNNRPGEKDFDARTTQLVFLGALRKDRWYGALSFQGGTYQFNGSAPDINTKAGSTVVSDQSIKLAESDITVGYYLTPKLSVFADIKSVSYTWVDLDHTMSYSGLGLGASWVQPIANDWSLYGNFGLIGNMTVRSKSSSIGKAGGFALEFGGITRLNESVSGTIGFKLQGQSIEYDNGGKQAFARGGLVFGIVNQF